jgi:putative glutamine amidotransferase
MRKPTMLKIGVTSSIFYPDINRLVFGHKTLCYFERDLARYLSRENVMPILIPDLEDEMLFPFLKQLDAIVLQGGSDIAPETYGATPILDGRWPGDIYRDRYELKILKFARQKKLPVLGICRGFQLLNVFFGGTLYQDIETQVEGSLKHRDAAQYDRINHQVLIKAGHLKNIYPRKKILQVNSVHHQGVEKLGAGLLVEAISKEDGIIEGFSYDKNDEFFLAIQWHPEFSHTLGNLLADPNPIYDYFLEKLSKKQKIKKKKGNKKK